MNKILGLTIIGIMFVLVIASVYYVPTAATSDSPIISPVPYEKIPLFNNKQLVINISIYYPQGVGSSVILYVTGPQNITMNGPATLGTIGSNGYLNISNFKLLTSAFQQNGQPLQNFIPGLYNFTFSIGGNMYKVPVIFTSPNVLQLIVYVFNITDVPLKGANVTVYSTAAGKFLNTSLTNAQGIAELTVPYEYNVTNQYTVTAAAPGYQAASQVITVPAFYAGAFPVKFKLSPLVFFIEPVYFETQGIQEPATPAQIAGQLVYVASGFEGTTFSIIVNATASGKPVSDAKIIATYTLFVKGVKQTANATATYIGNGLYNLSINLPTAPNNIPYTLRIDVTGIYQATTAGFIVLVSAQPNYIAIINELAKEISQLNATINALKSQLAGNVTALKAQIQELQNRIASINATLNSLQSTVTSLTNEINSLKSQLNSLSQQLNSLSSTVSSQGADISSIKSQISSMSALQYAALGLAIVALIVAIVALVLVFRKVA